MPDLTFNTYYRYDDLTAILKGFAEEYPHLVHLESIGQSYEGRDVWLATVTCFETGEDVDKPAVWVDGNIHASEVSPSTACLYLIHRLVTGYGGDEEVTRCLDTRTFMSARASTLTAPSGRWPTSPRSSAPAPVPTRTMRNRSAAWCSGIWMATGACSACGSPIPTARGKSAPRTRA
jgi:murein tripeptide amidase MpaA